MRFQHVKGPGQKFYCNFLLAYKGQAASIEWTHGSC